MNQWLRWLRSGTVLVTLFMLGCNVLPNWYVEEQAKPSSSHPLAGFWKAEKCSPDEWGLAIGPMGEKTYYVSFCGPGGCFEEGTYRPETTLNDDPAYKIIGNDQIEVKGADAFTKYVRCPGRKSDAQQPGVGAPVIRRCRKGTRRRRLASPRQSRLEYRERIGLLDRRHKVAA